MGIVHYFVQHAPGTGDLIAESLRGELQSFQVDYRDESAISFHSKANIRDIASIPYVKNAFAVLASSPRNGLESSVTKLGKALQNRRIPEIPSSTKNFRTMVHIDGELRALDLGARKSLEQAITRKVGGRVEARGMCQEYWVIGRSEMSELMLAARLPKKKRAPKPKGAISYELSSILIAASHPRHEDVFLDPFAGSGAFVIARLDTPAKRIWYSDTDRSMGKALRGEVKGDTRVGLLADDALQLPTFGDGEIDVIVTDPPWGEHTDIGMPYSDFARKTAQSFDRVLNARRGRFVLLSARRIADTLQNAFENGGFAITATHGILINGHPATVMVGGRAKSSRSNPRRAL
jgi:tRNA G10  N-methylase Trm11